MSAPCVSSADIDRAFYDSYTDTTTKKLDARLVDAKTGGPRRLTNDAADAQFRKEWGKIRCHLRELNNCAPEVGGPKVAALVTDCAVTGPNPAAPPYEPDKWNDYGTIQKSTNCYAYALNSRTGHPANDKPQPGDKSGTSGTSDQNTCDDITRRTLADGAPAQPGDPPSIEKAPWCPYQEKNHLLPPDRKGYYLVALAVTSVKKDSYDLLTKTYNVGDYHWYRQDEDGGWSSKRGHGTVRKTDASEKVITNPQTCNHDYWSRGPLGELRRTNYVFCGYFYVKKGGAQIAP